MLEAVIDPELHSSIVELGMVRDVAVDEDGMTSRSPSPLPPAPSGVRSKATSRAASGASPG